MSKTEKITAAFPLAEEQQLAVNHLLTEAEATLPRDKRPAVEQAYARMMEVRALSCTAQISVSRLDSIADVRRAVTDRECFGKQDRAIGDWTGARRVAMASIRPPVAPLEPLPDGETLIPGGEESSGSMSVTTAGAADVAVIVDPKNITAIRLSSGKRINRFAMPGQSRQPPVLSGNGRVLALTMSDQTLRMIDVETGNTLWSTNSYSRVLAWFDAADAVLLGTTDSSMPVLLDLRSGTSQPFEAPGTRIDWALGAPSADGHYVVGTYSSVSLMEVSRSLADQLASRPVRNFKLTDARASSSAVFLMSEASLLAFPSGSDLGWLNLQNGEQGVWRLSALRARRFIQLDNQTIMFDAAGDTPSSSVTRVLNVVDRTLATAKLSSLPGEFRISLAPHNGFLRYSADATIRVTQLELGASTALDDVISEAVLNTQLEKLARLDPGSTLPPDSESAFSRTFPPGPAALLSPSRVSANAVVSVIGVYEGVAAVSSPSSVRSHVPGEISVRIRRGSRPLVLVLSSYEPVRWTLNNPEGRKIEAILLSGYHPSTVVGMQNAPVIRMGSTYAYELGSPVYARLKQEIGKYVANPVNNFQGSYRGREFEVN